MGASGVMQGGSMGMQMYGGWLQANAIEKQGQSERQYYEFVANQDEKQANDVLAAGDRQVTSIQDTAARETGSVSRGAAQVAGAQKTALAASGVGSGSVTAEDIARDTETKKAFDEAVIRFNADSQSYETKTSAAQQAQGLRMDAYLKRWAGMAASEAARMQSKATMMGSATQVGGSFANWASNR